MGLLSKTVFVFLFSVFSSGAFAKATVSRQLNLTPETLKLIEAKIAEAGGRNEEMQRYLAYYPIDTAQSLSIACGPNLPDKEGKGCLLYYSTRISQDGSPRGTTLSISKKIYLKNKGAEVEAALAKLDPKTEKAHPHFGPIFDEPTAGLGDYFCETELLNLKYRWICYLNISEALN